jgi:hypothetical protein
MSVWRSTKTKTTTTSSKYCKPVIKKKYIYRKINLPAPKCSDSDYNKLINSTNIENDLASYISADKTTWLTTPLNRLRKIDPDFLYNCIQNSQYDKNTKQLKSDISEVNTQITDYTTQKGLLDTYDEMNNSSLYYYKNDLVYVICKISFLIILIATYIYFFKLTGIIEPLKNMFNTIITKGNTIIDKVTDKIKNPKPTNANPKPANANSKSANAVPKPVNAKRINAVPKPATDVASKPVVSKI